jgi:hypothetical protein
VADHVDQWTIYLLSLALTISRSWFMPKAIGIDFVGLSQTTSQSCHQSWRPQYRPISGI